MPVEIEGELHTLSLQIDRLKVLYEQYFIGIEKGPPVVARKEVEKQLDFLGRQNIGNTAVRFRYLGLLRRWKTYAERWDKILREIENSTYPRHRARVERLRLAAERERPRPPEALRPVDQRATTDATPDATPDDPAGVVAAASTEAAIGGEARAQPTSSASGPRVPRPAVAPSVPGMSDGELRALHQKYVEARRATGDPRADVRYESLVSTLQKQLPDILQRNRCQEVTFTVGVRDGKVILKAQPKR